MRDFIQNNYTPYEGDDEFLADVHPDTKYLWDMANNLIQEEIREK